LHPCFGANTGLTSEEWWFEVVKNTYLNTKDLNQIEHAELMALLPKISTILYSDVFSTTEGWILKENTLYTLQKLQEWRDLGSGPKLGIVSNFDNRLQLILEGTDLIK
jgi:hypothetical protein